MTRAPGRTVVAAGAVALLAAGCGATASQSRAETPPASVPVSSLSTSLTTPAGTWATVVMGGSAAQHDNFWQVFIRPAASSLWKLVTPPGTADNGGLVLAGGGASMITAFRPSQYLTYTPLSLTRNGGQDWSALSPLDAPLASTPGALAIQPSGGGLLALLASGATEAAASGSAGWKTLASERTVAGTRAGQRCGLQALTAAAYSPSGIVMLAGNCSRPGVAGIFADTGGTWQLAGPPMPADLTRRPITVLRLARTANQVVALMKAGIGPAASLLAAWIGDSGHATLSQGLALGGGVAASASFGSAGTAAVILTSGRGDVITSAGSQWHALPLPPPGTATLVPGPGGQTDALAVHGATLVVWRLLPGATSWVREQTLNVPIQYGSSG